MGVANDFSQLLPVADWLRAVTPTGGARLLNSQAQLHGNGHLYPATAVIVTTFGGQFGNKGGTATKVYHKRAASYYTGIRGCLLVVHVAVCIFRDTSLGKGTPPATKTAEGTSGATNQHDSLTSTKTRAVELPTSPRTGPTVPRANPGPPPPRGDIPKNLTNGAEESGIGRRSVAPGPLDVPGCG